MPAPEQTQTTAAAKRATAWAGSGDRGLGLALRARVAGDLDRVALFAIAAIPQAFLLGRRERRGR